MTSLVFIIVLSAAGAHAAWNFISKKVSGNLITLWCGMFAGIICLLPFSIYFIIKEGFDTGGIPFILISSAGQVLYFLLLFRCYRTGDISMVYPISRGTGIAVTTIVSFFFLHETISSFGMTGIAAILAGIIAIGFADVSSSKSYKVCFLSILTGICIAVYSMSDNRGVTYNNPFLHMTVSYIIDCLMLVPFVFKKGSAPVLGIWKNYKKYCLILGIGSPGIYMAILFAFRLMGEASYIVALREFSVVIGAVLGFIFFKEKPTLWKIFGIISIIAGLVFIKIG